MKNKTKQKQTKKPQKLDNNHLSCDIPPSLTIDKRKESNLLLFGNRFREWDNDLPSFINPDIASVTSLYHTKFTLIREYLIATFGFIAALILIIINCFMIDCHALFRMVKQPKNETNNENNDKTIHENIIKMKVVCAHCCFKNQWALFYFRVRRRQAVFVLFSHFCFF